MDGEHDEVALRKWYREVGHGLVTITDEQKILFDNLSVEFANMPKNRSQLEKMAEKDALTDGEAIFAREDIPFVTEEDAEPEIVEQGELSDEVVVGKTPISKRQKPLPKP